MENNAIEKIESVIPTTKLGIQKFAIDINQQLEDGEISGLELLKTFKMIEKLQEFVKDKMMEAAIAEADKHPGKELELFGVSFTKMESGVSYDYSGCNDRMYSSIISTEEKLKEEKKKREIFLKSIDGSINMEDIDEETGEVANKKVYPPVKSSKSTLQVKIK